MSCNIEDLEPSEIIFGCTDPAAINYDSSATVDDGTCIISGSTIFGCTDPLALNYSSGATEDNGSCVYELCPTGITISPSGIVYYTNLSLETGLPVDSPLTQKCCTENVVGEPVIWDSLTNRCKIDLKPQCIVSAISIEGIALNQDGQAISEECCTSLGDDYIWDQNLEYKGKKGVCVYTNYQPEECNLDLTNLTFNSDGTISIDTSSFVTGSTSNDVVPNDDQICVDIDSWYVYNPYPDGPINGYSEGSLLHLNTTDPNAVNLQVGQQIALSGMDINPISGTCYTTTNFTTLNLVTKVIKILYYSGNYTIVTSVYFNGYPNQISNNECVELVDVSNSGKLCVTFNLPLETITDTQKCINFYKIRVEPQSLWQQYSYTILQNNVIILTVNDSSLINEYLNLGAEQEFIFNSDFYTYLNNNYPGFNTFSSLDTLYLIKTQPSAFGTPNTYDFVFYLPGFDPIGLTPTLGVPNDINTQVCYNKVDYVRVLNTVSVGNSNILNIGDLIDLNTIISNLTLNETCCNELGQGLWSFINGQCYWKPPKLPETVSIGVSENDIIVTDSECTTLRVCLSFFLERPDNPECEPIGDVTANLNVYSGNTVDSGSLENIINVSQVSNYSLVRDGYCQWVQVCADITGFEGIPFKLKLDLQGVLDCCDYEIYLDDISVDCTIQDSIVVPNRLECPGFTIRRVIDNKKSWVYNDGEVINRIFAPSPDADIPWRYTNYFDQSGVYERHSRLVLNSKEMEITFNMCSGANCDPKLNVYELIDYKKNFQNFWIKFIEQFIPATTIFVAGERWCTTEDQICPVIELCDYDNKFELSDLGIFNTSGDSEKPGGKQNNGSNVPVYISDTKIPENKSGDYGSNKNDGPLIFDNFVGSFIKPDTSTLVNKELTLPRGLLPLLETGMNNFRSKMVPTVYIQI